MRCGLTILGVLACLTAIAPAESRGDVLVYTLGDDLAFTFQGETEVVPGPTVIYTHPRFGRLYFRLEDVERHEVDSLSSQLNKRINKAKTKKDVAAMFDAAQWALRHGMLNDFYKTIDAVLELKPEQGEAQEIHDRAKQIKELKAEMDLGIDEKPEEYKPQEDELRKFVKHKEFKIATSKHYILLYDTADEAPKPKEGQKKRKPRHEERLALLELVYESFMLTFYAKGIPLETPQDKLMVVLFNDERMYKDFSVAQNPALASAAGYWSQENNIAVFYDHGSNEYFVALQKMAKDIKEEVDEVKKLRDKQFAPLIQFANSLPVLFDIQQENMDITVVSHEATHQMAGNTGLLPRGVMIPSWVHEGLATYFEAPADGAWAGIGAVNEDRIGLYRLLADSPENRQYTHLNFLVGDQLFEYAGNHFTVLAAYSQAWALTHFMLEKHPEKFIEYYRLMGQMPRDVRFNEDVLTALFTSVFGSDLEVIDQEWRAYMRTLKTDLEIVLEDAD
jgi:hypothetical protein